MKTIIKFWLLLFPLQVAAQYIYFPASDIPKNLAPETERCYRFEVTDLEAQRTKLENKYGSKIVQSMIHEHPKGGKALEVSINDSIKGAITLTYFTDPKVCDVAHKHMTEGKYKDEITKNEDKQVKTDPANDGSLELRSGPSTSYGDILAKIPETTNVTIKDCINRTREGRWCVTSYNGKTGWIYLTYASKPETEPETEALKNKQNNPRKETLEADKNTESTKIDNNSGPSEMEPIDAAQFLKQYKENEIAVDKEYKNKPIAIKGTFVSVQRESDHNNDFAIYLENSHWKKGLRAFLSPEYIDDAGNLRKGQIITLYCIVEGNSEYHVDFNACSSGKHVSDIPSVGAGKYNSNQNKTKPSEWWAPGRDGKCKKTDGPSTIIDMYKGTGDVPETRDYSDASGNIYKVDVLMQVDAVTNSVWTFYRSKEDCVNEKEKAAENLSNKYKN